MPDPFFYMIRDYTTRHAGVRLSAVLNEIAEEVVSSLGTLVPESKFFKSKFLYYCRSMYLLIMCRLLVVMLVDQVRAPMDT